MTSDINSLVRHLKGIEVWFEAEGAPANAKIARDAAATLASISEQSVTVEMMAQRAITAEAKVLELSERTSEGWQPIDTAPQDGSWVLVWEQYINAKYHPAEVARFRDGRWNNSAGKSIPNASHWMSLPRSPFRSPVSGSTEGGNG